MQLQGCARPRAVALVELLWGYFCLLAPPVELLLGTSVSELREAQAAQAQARVSELEQGKCFHLEEGCEGW